ncbi:hypothetical protein P8452_75893 [Trifolium repens]|nr:hypothetical protein P8452_75893 [Trifolium repens]
MEMLLKTLDMLRSKSLQGNFISPPGQQVMMKGLIGMKNGFGKKHWKGLQRVAMLLSQSLSLNLCLPDFMLVYMTCILTNLN